MILYEQIMNKQESISVIGLGYVGLSLAIAFGKVANVIGFDIDSNKVNQYKNNIDLTNQVEADDFKNTRVLFTSNENKLKDAKFHIIAVPTPVYENNIPNLEHVIEASKILGRNLSKGSIIVYESTLFPGTTEDICIPILESNSGLKCGIDFKVGYSPERINPGDPINKLDSIVKIVSGMDKETLDIISKVYELIIKAGVFKVESIKVAEAAKLIENVQRDVNIALINEISIILNKLNLDTKTILEATSTKWNSLNFKPGLVGGHCIGVDSYYLTYISKKFGFHPELILTGRKVNDYIPIYVANTIIEKLSNSGKSIADANIAVFGFSFKEDCSDIRNTKVIDIIIHLENHGAKVKVVDPIVNPEEVLNKYGINIYDKTQVYNADGTIFAVAHEHFYKYSLSDIKSMYSLDTSPILIDVKGIFDKKEADLLGYDYWRL
ncbi:nucleotide sugar dehydrogenase [Tissierella praeacuta]|uniref:nucleotide sugar dehydrogenase n=1 Tax=Tissierella praeacuta TaxID=43131 RepID=UPI0028A8935C|nr:nucleotide sugar dehydrogenase [Tissierella praeacuta]